MNFYHSFWEFGYNKMDENLYNLHKLSVLSCLKSHGNIHLITTPLGKKFLGDLPYTSIRLFESSIDPNMSEFWSISKIHAYKQILNENLPFIHLDYDVFLFKKLPDYILEAGICAQETEKISLSKKLDIQNFTSVCQIGYMLDDFLIDSELNTGIFGGNDIESIRFYCDEVLKICEDPKNIKIFDRKLFKNKWSLSTILEQCYLSLVTKSLNKNVEVLFKSPSEYDKSLDLGYTHLMGSKKSKNVIDAVQKKILEYE